MQRRTPGRFAACILVAGLAASACAANGDNETSGDGGDKPGVVIGAIGNRVGPIPLVGRDLGTAIDDWFDMLNAQGGINGRQVELIEIESQYDVSKALAAYARLKRDGAVGFFPMGLAQAQSLGPMAQTDEIVMLATGTGQAETLDGAAAPFEFQGGASYPAQYSAMVQHANDDWAAKGEQGTPTFATLCWDTPAGKASCDAVKAAADAAGNEVAVETFVAPTTADLAAQALRFDEAAPDYVFLSGGAKFPLLALNAFRTVGLDAPVYNIMWGFSDDVWETAGADAEGYTGTSLANLAADAPDAYDQLREYFESEGKEPPEFFDEALYAQGLVMANLMAEAIRQADLLAGDGEITGDLLRQGMEKIADFDAGGLTCPVTLTPDDHIGTRQVNLYQIENGAPVRVGECVEGATTQ
ncbi:ABC transporter substrate-binding protein [Jiangella anatolica]|uniref:Leucine-binding protein domain-containing protein n=1 Tax=Jiangella anatolica TaxID=2670374 RepID=A0A2W2CT56_9ACTN|nr:ABC transporter substrate-binding protein [Jiangella anatolica]PZF83343.1 hypothetical protein C1I92_12945 [Jiangella anatolica]